MHEAGAPEQGSTAEAEAAALPARANSDNVRDFRIRTSLRLKAMLWTMFMLTTMATTLAWLFQRIDLENRRSLHEEQLLSQSHLVALNCARSLGAEDPDAAVLRDLQFCIEPSDIVCAALIDPTGRLMGFQSTLGASTDGLLADVLTVAERRRSDSLVGRDEVNGVEFVCRKVRFPGPSQPSSQCMGLLVVGSESTYLLSQHAEMSRQIWVTTGLIVSVFSFLSWVLCHFLVLPVRRLIEGTVRLSHERFDVPVEIRTRDELSVLANSINRLASNLQDSRTRLTSYNRQLELTVEERTRELKEALGELQAADRMKDAFLSSISHEFRTPITSLRAFAEILLEEPLLDEEHRKEFLGIILQESERLSSLVDKVLDVIQLRAGTMPIAPAPCRPDEMVDEACRLLRQRWPSRSISIEVALAMDLPETVFWDRSMIGRVFREVLENSVQFATGSVEVELVVERRADRVILEFRDHGPGIRPEELDRVFENFRQGGETLTSKPLGTGLGLPLCRLIVELHEGSIEARLPAEGPGVCFHMELPICPVRAEHLAQRPRPSTAKRSVSPLESFDLEPSLPV